ncbi:MAG: BolA family transcriptional regulator [Azospirillaceae bacterium]|nr:BolA family transcriptional regulator [Azospirillaceae bacterium]
MEIADRIRRKLTETFAPQQLVIVDASHRHAGHVGAAAAGETHFEVTIISDVFDGRTRVDRQRLVYAALAQELAERVHALALTTLTVDEAIKRGNSD